MKKIADVRKGLIIESELLSWKCWDQVTDVSPLGECQLELSVKGVTLEGLPIIGRHLCDRRRGGKKNDENSDLNS